LNKHPTSTVGAHSHPMCASRWFWNFSCRGHAALPRTGRRRTVAAGGIVARIGGRPCAPGVEQAFRRVMRCQRAPPHGYRLNGGLSEPQWKRRRAQMEIESCGCPRLASEQREVGEFPTFGNNPRMPTARLPNCSHREVDLSLSALWAVVRTASARLLWKRTTSNLRLKRA
jgi:hypothetical protein